MIFEDDDTLRMYVEESLEHLSDIESDLLAIEEAGLENGEELINNVFRAAHSIKGGAGFMGLTTIKELSHNLENALNMMRNGELHPTPPVISTLLAAFDKLTELIGNIENSNDAEITPFVEDLIAIDRLPEAPIPSPPPESDPLASFNIDKGELDKFLRQGKYIYRLSYDLQRDILDQGKVVNEIINALNSSGMILDSTDPVVPPDAQGNRPFLIIFASIIEPDIAPLLAELDESAVEDLTPLLGTGQDEEAVEEIAVEAIALEPFSAPPAPEPPSPIEPPREPTPPRPTPPERPERGAETRPPETEHRTNGQTSIRVNLELLDTLMTLAGELVLSRNQLMQGITGNNARAVETSGQRIDMITSELQEAIMRTRMQPISNVFNKFTRVVRDLAGTLHKKVDLFIEGKDVELDKTIIESINDPLTHLVRNSVDHGIESPEDRSRLGKAPTGRIFLKAFHEAGQVNIEISDDGGGIDGNAMAAAAVRKGLLTEAEVAMMTTKEKVGLIFLPGFSTAQKVTDVSGRGVGMDVVKTNLDKLGGIIDIHSKPGKGTIILIKLPLTLAIIPSQIVSVENERYAIPQVNLDELLRVPAAQVKDRIEKVGNADVVRLRGALLPLLRLTDLLKIAPTFIHPKDGKIYPDKRRNLSDRRQEDEATLPDNIREMRSGEDRRYRSESAINIAVVSAGNFKYGLVVDELRDSEEIVVKPLGRHLSKSEGYAGATIMGDGRVALILDVASLAKMGALNETSTKTLGDTEAPSALDHNTTENDRTALLTFKGGATEHFAAPLNLVERIERVKAEEIEMVGGRRVIQYRGGTLPLNEISEVANVAKVPENSQYEVVVFRMGGRETGLLVTPPVDAVEVDLKVDASTLKQNGIMGSLIVGEHTTLMVDIFELVRTVNPTWFEENRPTGTKPSVKSEEIRILFAEDSAFFRNQVSDFLAEEGFIVTTAEDGLEAWNALEKGEETFTIILTDLEMPNMDGFELTKKIKGSETYKHLPVIALTSLASERDIRKGKEAGIDSYQIKLDRENLIEVVREYSL